MQRSALVKIAPLIRARVSTYSLRNESTNTGIDPASDAYQFIQRSEIPTYHFQKSLRRLPIPTLEDTCRRYIKAVKAVFDENEAKETFKIVDRFLFGEAQDLQKELTHFDKRNPHTSYISEPWFDMYLSARVPCPINYNPFMMFAPDPEESFNNQLVRATNFVISCGRFKRALDAEILAPEIFHLNPAKSDTPSKRRFWKLLPPSISWFGAVIFKAFPLDMSQYKSLFGGCRIPQKDKDRLHLETNSRHFIVAKKGQFYSVELFDENGKLYPPGHVHACLHKILREQHDQPKDEECVGSLTTLDRDSWAEIRSDMIHTSRRNFESLRAIEDALFLLCLDDLKSMDPQRLAQALLCGDDGRNRWFDKCFQLIVDGNGQATINFEHSWGDGVAVLRLMEETLKDTVNQRFVVPGQEISKSVPTEKLIRKLGWELNESLRSAIKRAQQKHVELCANLDFAVLEHKALTKARIKDAKLSPDAIMQLGMQLAYHGIYQEFVPTYESCSTAAFLKGRTECIRSATVETREAVLAFEKVKVVQDKDEYGRTPTQMFENEKIAEPNRNMYDRIPTDKQEVPTPSKLYKLLRKCSDQHSKLVKEASMGQGFDRHLFGLKHMAQRLHRPYDEIFTDPIYEQMGHFVLSTSTLSTDTIYFGGFGPVVRDGFGVGYNVTDQKLGAAVTSYKDKRDAAEFCKALDAALNRIKDVIEKSGN